MATTKPHEITYSTKLLRWSLFGCLILGFIAFFYFGAYRYFDFAMLEAHAAELQAYVKAHFWLAWLTYWAVFFAAALFCIPSLIFLMVVGGFLFGILPSFIAIVLAEILSALIIFFMVRTTAGTELTKYVPQRVLNGLQQDNKVATAGYLIFLRLFPLVPFAAVNIGAGLLKLSPRLFGLTTFFGIMPEAILYADVGTDVEKLMQQGQAVDMGSLMLTPSIFWPLCIGAGLALAPVIYMHLRRVRSN